MADSDAGQNDVNMADLHDQLKNPKSEYVQHDQRDQSDLIDMDNPVIITRKPTDDFGANNGMLLAHNDYTPSERGIYSLSTGRSHNTSSAHINYGDNHSHSSSNYDYDSAVYEFTPQSTSNPSGSDTITLPDDVNITNSDITVHDGFLRFEFSNHPDIVLNMSDRHPLLDQDDRANGYGQRNQVNGFNRLVLSSQDNNNGTHDIAVMVLNQNESNNKNFGHIAYQKNGYDAGSIQGADSNNFNAQYNYSHHHRGRQTHYSNNHFKTVLGFVVLGAILNNNHRVHGSIHFNRNGNHHLGNNHTRRNFFNFGHDNHWSPFTNRHRDYNHRSHKPRTKFRSNQRNVAPHRQENNTGSQNNRRRNVTPQQQNGGDKQNRQRNNNNQQQKKQNNKQQSNGGRRDRHGSTELGEQFEGLAQNQVVDQKATKSLTSVLMAAAVDPKDVKTTISFDGGEKIPVSDLDQADLHQYAIHTDETGDDTSSGESDHIEEDNDQDFSMA